MKSQGEKIAMLTAYDATFARVFAAAGVDALLVGDSLGMVVQGMDDTLSVSLERMAYHIRCVRAGAPAAVVIGDMPFASYHLSPQQAFQSAATLMAAGATMVKMEGGALFADTVHFLTARGIPVCAHAGLMPQWVRLQGGYKIQGRDAEGITVQQDAAALQDAGACMIVLELIPAALAKQISDALTIPTIGIGCGGDCDGQVLVCHDILGMSTPKKFVRNFLRDNGGIEEAARGFVQAVKSGEFPTAENAF